MREYCNYCAGGRCGRIQAMTRIELERAARPEKESPEPLPAWQREILEERIAADDAEPDAGSPWEEVKRRILAML